jgi:hypothetical protein
MTRTALVLETLVYSPFSHHLWLVAQESFIVFSCHESLRLYIGLFYEWNSEDLKIEDITIKGNVKLLS